MKDIVIRGYYGFGNLGDDVLMLTSMKIAKDVFPSHNQILCTENPSPDYLKKMAPGAPVINQSAARHTDIFFHGGGGVHFDFSRGSSSYGLLNTVIRTIGYSNFGKIYQLFRKLKGTQGLQFNHQVGVGIGVGTFSKGSRKFYQSVLKLHDYDLLLVRDSGSYNNVQNLGLDINCQVFTDIAFYTEAWLTPMSLHSSDSIGIILRDWPYDDHSHVKAVKDQYEQIKHLGFPVKFYSFDPSTDRAFIQMFSEVAPVIEWDPHESSIEQYLQDLASNQLIISSRAHGAILGACLGVPGICLNIEPKLEAVASMLPNSYKLSDYQNLDLEVTEMINRSEEYRKGVSLDLNTNRSKINDMLKSLREFADKINES